MDGTFCCLGQMWLLLPSIGVQIADIWSCGVMVYVMLVGAYPFERPEDKHDNQKLQKMIQVCKISGGPCLASLSLLPLECVAMMCRRSAWAEVLFMTSPYPKAVWGIFMSAQTVTSCVVHEQVQMLKRLGGVIAADTQGGVRVSAACQGVQGVPRPSVKHPGARSRQQDNHP